MHELSLDNCRKFIRDYLVSRVDEPLKFAEVGSEGGSYNHCLKLTEGTSWTYTTFDITKGFDVNFTIPNTDDWELPAEHRHAYDVLISGQVLEHVPRPWVWIKQFAQLGKPGALVWITAPNTWEFHEYPLDCWRIWPDGMKALFAEANIEVLEAYKLYTDTVGIGRIQHPKDRKRIWTL